MSEEQNKHTETAPKPNLIAEMAGAQVERTVKYKDENNKDATRKITVTNPDIGPSMEIMDLANVGNDEANYGQLFGRIMSDVIAAPVMDYKTLNDDLPDKYKSKTVTKKNKRGDTVQLQLVFPGFQTAIDIVMDANRPSGASNIYGTLTTLDKEVFRKGTDKLVVRESYWNAGGEGYGLGGEAIKEGLEFLTDAISYKGNFQALLEGYRFLQNLL
ncbi:hypothetical protein [Lactiplantibacillus daowaiensis]|uniref:Uncharacterized protein n=1 Tax=Lactiplantibacillus daowaiensis TaxID=2559918 RepID=A0ABW1RYS7_9LACO|nr:hypothetical protein [Lactiplantibacillus daowaiensis]